MNNTTLTVFLLLMLTHPASVLAEKLAVTDPPSKAVASDIKSAATEKPATQESMPGKGVKSAKQAQARIDKGKARQGCKKHGGAKYGKGKGGHEKHRQIVKRLDMIEARMAKIEAMLESLMRR